MTALENAQFTLKFADSEDEFEQIFALNYQTFVEEIPQHETNSLKKLKDKFHADNTYLICKEGDQVVGMIACCGKRPFSLDAKVAQLDSYLPPHKNAYEIRLLAVKKAYRRTKVAALLLRAVVAHLLENKADLALISGTVRELAMYQKLGFQPFYRLVGKPEAYYQPMYITEENLQGGRWLK